MRPELEHGDAARNDRRDFLTVDGMFCAACAASVEAVLNRQPGVREASVNFAADAAVIDWAPSGDDRERLLDTVRKLGYEARLVGDESVAADATTDPARDLGMRLVVAVFFGMWAMLPSVTLYFDTVADPAARLALAWAAGVFALPVILYSGIPFYRMGYATLRHRVAGVDALILLGVAGSVALSLVALAHGRSEVFFEVAVALITLQLVGRMLDLRVRRRARDALVSLFELAPTTVRKILEDGTEHEVRLENVEVGDRVSLCPGERVAVDGRIVAGSAEVDRSLMTGESDAVLLEAPALLSAGERVLDGTLRLEVTATAGKRRIDELARQVRQTLARKPAWQRTVDAAAGYFLWIATAAALLGAALVAVSGGSPAEAGARALAVFVIACPCALALAAPLVGLVAAGTAARNGIVLRDLNAITAAAVPDRLFLDKTGTITEGTPSITAVHPGQGRDAVDVVRIAAAAEQISDHPVALALRAAAEMTADCSNEGLGDEATSRIVTGCGVIRTSGGIETRVGKPQWFEREGIEVPPLPPTDATRVAVTVAGDFVGAIDLEDEIRPGIPAMIDMLRDRGIEPVILSGDAEGPVRRVADSLHVAARAGLSPEDKRVIIGNAREKRHTVAFAGDGLNDAPALAAADLGIAVGRSTDAARTAAAVAFVEADAGALPELFDLTARTRRIIAQNLVLAVSYNAIAIPAAVLGWVHPVIAAVAMALSSITVTINALRAGRIPTA